MSDELNRLRRAFESAAPSPRRRAEALDRAMTAFDAEFARDGDSPAVSLAEGPGAAADEASSSSTEKKATAGQGSVAPVRPTHRNPLGGPMRPRPAQKGFARLGRLERMRGLSRRALTVGGTGLAAAIAAVVVIGQSDYWPAPSLGARAPSEAPALTDAAEEAARADEVLAEPRRPISGELRATERLVERAQTETWRTRALEQAEAQRRAELAAQATTSRRAPPSSVDQDGFSGGLPGASTPAFNDLAAAPPAAESDTEVDAVVGQATGFAIGAAALDPEASAYDRARPNSDRFPEVKTSPVKSVAEEPVSTFSIDVDTASYAFLRGGLNAGRIPPADAIRVEELINYFPYDYAGPESAETPFRAHVSVTPTPWNADTKLMHIGIKGYQPSMAERPRANLVLLVDTSGSMNQPNKLPLLVNSFRLLLGTLDEDDTVSIVTYAGSAGVALEPTAASKRATIEAALDQLQAGGGTAGAAGLRLAYDKARESFDADAVNRVILATDGDFNVGFSSPDAMKEFVERQRESGVFLSVLGFGRGNYHDTLMQALAQNGNGVAAYIDTLSEARKVLADEAGGALIPIAKDVKIQVEFNPQIISEYRLIGYETRALAREDFNDDTVDAGDIGSGHTVTAIYEVTPKGSPAELIDPLRYGTAAAPGSAPAATPAAASGEMAFLKIRFKRPDEDESTLISRPIDQSDEVSGFEDAPEETRFATAVAAFGQRLRREGRLGDFGYADILDIASAARGEDPYGYRSEFLNLVRLAQGLDRGGDQRDDQ